MTNLYLKIPATIRAEIKSVLITFVSVFILTVAMQVSGNDVAFTSDVIAAIAVAAVRAGVKAAAALIVTSMTPSQPQ